MSPDVPNQDSSIQAAFDRALALGAAGDDAGAEAALRDLLRRTPDHRRAAATLAHFLAGNARPRAAADVVLRGFGNGAFGPAEAAAFLRRCQCFDEAYRVCETTLAMQPDDARLRSMAGTIALNLGLFDAAFEHLRAAVASAPEDGAAWLRIAHTRRFADPDDPGLAMLEAAMRNPPASPAAREAIGFALGKAYDDLGRYALASEHLREANASYRARVPWSASAWRDAVDHLRQQRWTARETAEPDFRPLFVVGLPRSGTTLAASLIERHFGARNRGETPWVSETARMLGGPPRSASELTDAAAFLTRQLRQDDDPARFHIDKNPLNFRHIGLIRALLPQAKIIWMLRDARDTALSSWMQHFAHPDTGFAYAWSDIAAFSAGHARLLEDAHGNAGDSLMLLRYEDLVTDTPTALRTLAAFIGAEPVEMPSETTSNRVIATASLWQARQPIHSGSIGRWRNYRELIPELSEHFAVGETSAV